ncbi:DUF2934 domain-containing protein [Chelativorans sp.]|uniref:DUF2934 domain-containing protein n=1 Tax=Chelativorans sp. TaxID=2203393 RepID=UPI00281186A8|nr:DUF2934 domain-containing protein [Chelativorans sp.]
MSSEKEEKIRRRAYEIWESEGRPHGREWDHWLQAARELQAEEGGFAEGEDIPEMPEDFPEGGGGSGEAGGGSSGLSSGLQPGGTIPGGSPATGEGSIGTGGGSTRRRSTGNAKGAKK